MKKIFSEMTNDVFSFTREELKLSDFNVLVTVNTHTDAEMYYFIRKHRKISVNGDNIYGGNISSMTMTMQCDHVIEKKGMSFKIIKCRTSQDGTPILRLMADYLESI